MKLSWTMLFCIVFLGSGNAVAGGPTTSEFETTLQKVILEMDAEQKKTPHHGDFPLENNNTRESATSQGPLLTLEKCLEKALRDNLSLRIKQKQVDSKEAEQSASFRSMLPNVSVISTRSDVLDAPAGSSMAESYSTMLSIAQPIYHGNALWNSWEKAKIGHGQALLAADRETQRVIQGVKNAWYDILTADHLAKSAQSALERLRKHAKHAKAFFDEGTYWANDVLQAQVAIAKGEQRLIEAQNSLFLAKANLNKYMQRPITAPFRFAGELKWVPMPWKIEHAFEHAQQHRKDLQGIRMELLSARLTEQVKKADMLPKLDLRGTTSWSANHVDYDGARPTTTAMVTLSWNAWEWGKTMKEVEAARSNTQKSYLELQDLEESILLEVRKAFLNAEEFSQKVMVLKKSLDQAQENYRVNQIRYEEQLGTATNVLDAMDLLTSTQNDTISAISNYLKSLASLDLAVGKDGWQPNSDENQSVGRKKAIRSKKAAKM